MSEHSLKELVNRNPARVASRTEPKREEEAEYQSFTYGRIGAKPQLMVEFFHMDGFSEIYPYIDIKRIARPDPERCFEVELNHGKFVVEGQNLSTVIRYLKQHRVDTLKPSPRASAFTELVIEPLINQIRFVRTPPRKMQDRTLTDN